MAGRVSQIDGQCTYEAEVKVAEVRARSTFCGRCSRSNRASRAASSLALLRAWSSRELFRASMAAMSCTQELLRKLHAKVSENML